MFYTRSNGVRVPATVVGFAPDGLVHLEYFRDAVKMVNRQCKVELISFAIPSADSPPPCSRSLSPPPNDRGRSPSLHFLSVYFFFGLFSFNSSVHISMWTWIPRLQVSRSNTRKTFYCLHCIVLDIG